MLYIILRLSAGYDNGYNAQPNGRDCAELRREFSYNGTVGLLTNDRHYWNDADCSFERAYICERIGRIG